MIIVISEKLRFQNVFRPHENEKACSISSSLKSVFEKFRFRDGLVWTEGLTGEKKGFVFKFLWRGRRLRVPNQSCGSSTLFLSKRFFVS